MEPFVSVLIPTFKRAPFLKSALNALKEQTFKDFEVIVVVKSSGDETEKILEENQHYLRIKIVIQHEEFVSKAYNLGIKEAKGEIIAIMDDDSVPETNWLEKYVEMYREDARIGGISGSALNAEIVEGKLCEVPEMTQLSKRWQEYYYSRWSYNRPIKGMEDFWIFIGKDGLVHTRSSWSIMDREKAFPSLLLMGANMSVKRKAIQELKIQEDLILGFTYEQLLAYEIWRRGYKLLHDPSSKVFHIVHEESLGRFFKTPMRAANRDAEYILSFFVLKPYEREVSWPPYFLELASLIISRALNARNYGFVIALSRIYGCLYGFVVGCASSISRFVGGKFSIKNSLLKFVSSE